MAYLGVESAIRSVSINDCTSIHTPSCEDCKAIDEARHVCFTMASTVYERSSSQGDDVELHQFPQHQEPIIVDKINRNRNLNPKKGLNTLPTLPSPHEDSIDDINLPVKLFSMLIQSRKTVKMSQVKHKNPLHKGLISYTACEERQVIKKLDRHLVLFLALLYMLSFLGTL